MPRFISVPVILYNPKELMEGKEPDECSLIEVEKVIDIDRLESYAESVPASDFRDDNKIWSDVVMQSGDSFVVNLPFAELNNLVVNFHPSNHC